MIDINFFGTHNFATTILQKLINCPDIQIKTVFTMPDHPVGRKQKSQSSPVKLLAQKYNLNIQQPAKLTSVISAKAGIHDYGSPTWTPAFAGMTNDIDLNIVVDYGLLIPQSIIDAPKYGTINIHPSLLPKYRGPSPIQSVLINGGQQTGVSIMLIDAKMDHGPILVQKTVPIDHQDIYPTLAKKLATEASKMLTKAIGGYMSGKIVPQPQDHDQATFCKMLTREDGLIDFDKTAQEIYNQYRGLTPWPGIYAEIKNEELRTKNLRLKLLNIKPAEKKVETGKLIFESGQIFIGCKDNSIEVLELQLEGKKSMTAKDFINGNKQLENQALQQ